MRKTENIPVFGMMCQHCVKAVTMALEDDEGVIETSVSLDSSSALVTYEDQITTLEKLRAAITQEGYFLERQEETDDLTNSQ